MRVLWPFLARVEVIGQLRRPRGNYPKIGDLKWRCLIFRTTCCRGWIKSVGSAPKCESVNSLATVAILGEDDKGRSLRNIDDDELATALERFARDLSQRRGA
jgi:hypothetical protein